MKIASNDRRLFNPDKIKIHLLAIGSKSHHIRIDSGRVSFSSGQSPKHFRCSAEIMVFLRLRRSRGTSVSVVYERFDAGSGAKRRRWLATLRHSTETTSVNERQATMSATSSRSVWLPLFSRSSSWPPWLSSGDHHGELSGRLSSRPLGIPWARAQTFTPTRPLD